VEFRNDLVTSHRSDLSRLIKICLAGRERSSQLDTGCCGCSPGRRSAGKRWQLEMAESTIPRTVICPPSRTEPGARTGLLFAIRARICETRMREGPDPTARPLHHQLLLVTERRAVVAAVFTPVCVGSHVTGVPVRRVCECRCRTCTEHGCHNCEGCHSLLP
jgi:hypothetical protein